MAQPPIRHIGTFAAIAAAVFFTATIGMVKLAAEMGAIGILGIRITGTTFLLTLFLQVFFPSEASSLTVSLRSNPRLILLATGCIGTGFFLFAWAFLHGYGTSVAQAYLLFPFSMVFGGLMFFGERLRRHQWAGVCMAAIGVIHDLWVHTSLSWVTWVQAFVMTAYFLLHRVLHSRGVTSLQLLVGEFWLLMPLACICVVTQIERIQPFTTSLEGVFVIIGLWFITTLAYISYIVSNQYLSCAAFGMWGSLEPILILSLSVLFFDAHIESGDLFTYVPMFLGSLLVVL